MCIPGCGGTGKSQLIRALTEYFLITKRMQMMRKLAPTGIAAADFWVNSVIQESREPSNQVIQNSRKNGHLLNIS